MSSHNSPGGEPPDNEDDIENLIEFVPEELIEFLPEEPFESPIENQNPWLGTHERLPLVDITNLLTPEEDPEVNITIAHVEKEEESSISRPKCNTAEAASYLTGLQWFTPIDVESYDQLPQGGAPTPRHAALFTLDTELNTEDPMQTWPYAMDVFVYQREREKVFIIRDYMPHQVDLTPWKRTLLISWMVTVHQAFGTFRETLFLAVKIVDLYLCNFVIEESLLQLLGATAIYIASKFEEKEVLLSESLLQACHLTYSSSDLVWMERNTLSGIGFDLGIPIGYRFLRRYARSAQVPEPIWTLASYILELNLMEYTTIGHSDSQMAAAALFIALRMCGEAGQLDEHTWNAALVYYSGYELEEFAWLVPALNGVLHRSGCNTVKDVRSLYSTPMLYEVAHVPPLTNEEIFCHNPELYHSS